MHKWYLILFDSDNQIVIKKSDDVFPTYVDYPGALLIVELSLDTIQFIVANAQDEPPVGYRPSNTGDIADDLPF